MFDFLAPLFNRQVVWVKMFNGEGIKRWAWRTPFGLHCRWGGEVMTLEPDGTVSGNIYFTYWRAK